MPQRTNFRLMLRYAAVGALCALTSACVYEPEPPPPPPGPVVYAPAPAYYYGGYSPYYAAPPVGVSLGFGGGRGGYYGHGRW